MTGFEGKVKCESCAISLEKKPRRDVVFSDAKYYCKKCYIDLKRSSTDSDPKPEIKIQLKSLKSTIRSHKCIFQCPRSELKSLCRINKELRTEILI